MYQLLLAFSLFSNTIYCGHKSLYKAYYDDTRTVKIMELWGPYFGYHDQLRDVNVGDTIAKSDVGVLYKNGEQLLYKSAILGLKFKLKKQPLTDKIERRRKLLYSNWMHLRRVPAEE